jgi:hypothetical protein
MTEPNGDFIMPLVKEHFKEGGIRDDGSCSEYYGSPEDFIKFARVLYKEDYDDGCFEATGGN